MTGIIPAALAHAPLLAWLHAGSFGGESWSIDQMRGSLMLDTTRGWVALKDDGPAGFILCHVAGGEGDILTFCVQPAARGQGVGERLLRHALAHAFSGQGSFHLEAAVDNGAARRLYERCGFVMTGTRRGYYRRGAAAVDGVSYRLEVGG
jgi:ribosomal-protein-alanine N-acetyltransferase